MLKILQAPHVVLSQPTKPVVLKNGTIDKTTKKLIADMEKELRSAKEPEGVGLAAPQIGKSLQLFIMMPTPKSPISVFINPVIVGEKPQVIQKTEDKKKDKESIKLEGCLSLQDIWGEVKRSPEITTSYIDKQGTPHTKTFKGFAATIIQHECDHLQGILFPKRVLEQQGELYKSKKNGKNEIIFEEIEL